MSARAVVPPSIHAGTPTAHRKRRRISRARPTRATARDENDGAVAVKVWEGGGDGLVRPPDPTLIEHIRARWDASGWDLERRWDLAKELWAHERSRAGLTDDWKFGWHGAKSYVGITYMWGDPGAERGEVFLSKYLILDPRFDNVLGCLRHELAHALVGPTEDHGPVWVAAAKALGTPRDWATDTTGSFYNRPLVVAGWSAHDVANATGNAFKLPPELFEKNVWAGDGTRTVFTDQDGNVVM
jgi:hypothetical protein